MEILNNPEVENETLVTRKKLLPTWIKVFSWFFLGAGGLAVLAIPASLMGFYASFGIFGFRFTGNIDLPGMVCLSIFWAFGLVAYGLLWYKDWGVTAGLGLCLAEFILGMVSFIGAVGQGSLSIPFEILMVIPFTYVMIKILDDWEAAKQ